MPELPQTEASCLLASGALYRRRVGLVPDSGDGQLVFAGFKKGAFSLYFGDAPIYHFDLEGRWQRAFVESTHYLKGLDTRVHAIDRVREGSNLVLKRRTLDAEETQALDLQVRGIALGLIGELDRGRIRRQDPPDGKAEPLGNDHLRGFLQRITAWDPQAWDAHRAAYHETYGPLPFLPPECQNPVVLQATLGNAGGIAFGGGPATGHAIRTPEEFASHVDRVGRLLGRRLDQCRLVFLAGSDVLRLPPDQVVACLDAIAARLPIRPGTVGKPTDGDGPGLAGVHAFLDEFSAAPGPEALRAYREHRLVHASLGVESGSPEIRHRFGRTWRNDELHGFVADLKAAGIGVSLLTLVGAGGPEHSAAHIAATTELIGSLPLARGDAVFLLDERELRADQTTGIASDPFQGESWTAQQAGLKQTLAPLRERGVKVLTYSLDKQWA